MQAVAGLKSIKVFCKKDICGLSDVPLLDPCDLGGPREGTWIPENVKWKLSEYTGSVGLG